MPNKKRRSQITLRFGFTLIEVLVSVAIIALLIAILLPSLQHAREQSHRLVCRNNLRSIWTGIITYTIGNRDRVPFMEDVNEPGAIPSVAGITGPNADPFTSDPRLRTTIGRVLFKYVVQGSWQCPKAVAGYPKNAGSGSWKMTYALKSAGAIGRGIPYDKNPWAYTGNMANDPVFNHYVDFDGRPLRLVEGRRYTLLPTVEMSKQNQNKKGYWTTRFPIISEMRKGGSRPSYPHIGPLAVRNDLGKARSIFEDNINGGGFKTGHHELHADGDRADIFFTRHWEPHWPGY